MGVRLTAIVPDKQKKYSREFQKGFIKVLKEINEGVKKDLRATVRTWKPPRPQFRERLPKSEGGDFVTEVYTDNRIYGYVDEGTRPHVIRPRRALLLRFRPGYTAKTAPSIFASRAGGSFGAPVFAKQVNHPGTKARHFVRIARLKWQGEMTVRIRALNKEIMKD